jgi:hypothetical protein
MAFASASAAPRTRVRRRVASIKSPSGKLPPRDAPGRRRPTKKSPVATINQPGKPTLGPVPKAPMPAPQAPALKAQSPEFDPAYFNRIDVTDRKEQGALSALDANEQAVKFDFGIEDPTNPFSRANGLKRAWLARSKASSAGLAHQGQLYSGAHERAGARMRFGEEQDRAALRASYEGAIGQIGAQRAGVKFSSEEERAQAFEDWLARAPEADAPITEEAAAPGGAAPKASASAAQKTTSRAPSPEKLAQALREKNVKGHKRAVKRAKTGARRKGSR